jgi:hypothetical protein
MVWCSSKTHHRKIDINVDLPSDLCYTIQIAYYYLLYIIRMADKHKRNLMILKGNNKNKRITIRLHDSEMELLENHSLLHRKPKAHLVRYIINYYLKGK